VHVVQRDGEVKAASTVSEVVVGRPPRTAKAAWANRMHEWTASSKAGTKGGVAQDTASEFRV